MRKVCSVADCIEYEAAKGLCATHLKRFQRHGTVEAGRPLDWGERRKHPLYSYWKSLRKSRGGEVCLEWLDFWVFVRDVGARPDPRGFIQRPNATQKFSLGNFEWKLRNLDPIKGKDQKEYKKEYIKKWRLADPDRFRSYSLKRRFGITLDDYNKMLEAQGGVCAICRLPEVVMERGRVRNLHVDHDHDTNAIRGLLCDACNRGLGHFRDSISNLRAAIAYLEKSRL